jgi:hypothetical protein
VRATALETGPIAIRPVRDRRGLREFLDLPARLHAADPNWVRPLRFERRDHLNPDKNPYFDHAEASYWVARRDGQPVGRISAQIDRVHLARHADATGHFGFLEAEDDPAVFAALLGTAEAWLRSRGMGRALGPYSLSINDESGLLIDGFDSPPSMMMGHALRHYGPRIEEQGYHKIKDLICYRFDVTRQLPERARRLVERHARSGRLRFRPTDMARFDQELTTLIDVFNDAWSDNWGFVPLSPAEIRHLGKNLRPLIKPEFVWFGEVDGETAAMVVTLPNLNEVIADLNGRLLPFGWAKLLWRLKVRGTRTARMPLMGVRRRHHGTPLGAALAIGVIDAVWRWHREHGSAEEAELSWVLEDNRATHEIIRMVGGQPYKTYRLYEKALT